MSVSLSRPNAESEGFHISLDELKALVQLHAIAQGIPPAKCRETLARIHRIQGTSPDSWANQWIVSGEQALAESKPALATACFNLGRFPFVESPEQKTAHDKCIDAFRRWQQNEKGGPPEKLQLTVGNHRFTSYVRRCGSSPAPVLLVIGGIVSIKEQWGAFLQVPNRLPVDVVVTEFPGVGENELPWNTDASDMIRVILDALRVTVGSGGCYAVALSFGGTLALQQAARDPRIRGIVTAGAPIQEFFGNASWWSRTPATTRRTLAHILSRNDDADTFRAMQGLAVPQSEIQKIQAPIFYIKSKRDEIIPGNEAAFLAGARGNVEILEIDDVHGSPLHAETVRLFVVYSFITTLFPRTFIAKLLRAVLSVKVRLKRIKRYRLNEYSPTKSDGGIS